MKNLSNHYLKFRTELFKVTQYIIEQLTPYINPDTPISFDQYSTEISGSFAPAFQINIDFQDFEQYDEIVNDIDPNDPNKFYYIVARTIVIDKNETYFSNEVETIYLDVLGKRYEVTLELTLNEVLNRVELKIYYEREVDGVKDNLTTMNQIERYNFNLSWFYLSKNLKDYSFVSIKDLNSIDLFIQIEKNHTIDFELYYNLFEVLDFSTNNYNFGDFLTITLRVKDKGKIKTIEDVKTYLIDSYQDD